MIHVKNHNSGLNILNKTEKTSTKMEILKSQESVTMADASRTFEKGYEEF